MSDTNINFGDVSVTGGQAALGNNAGASFSQINNGGDSAKLKPIFDEAQRIVENEMPAFSSDSQELMEMYGSPASMVGSMYESAADEIENETLPAGEFDAQKKTWFERAKTVAPALVKGGLIVGEAVVSTYVSKSPVVAGLLAAIEFAKQQVRA